MRASPKSRKPVPAQVSHRVMILPPNLPHPLHFGQTTHSEAAHHMRFSACCHSLAVKLHGIGLQLLSDSTRSAFSISVSRQPCSCVSLPRDGSNTFSTSSVSISTFCSVVIVVFGLVSEISTPAPNQSLHLTAGLAVSFHLNLLLCPPQVSFFR